MFLSAVVNPISAIKVDVYQKWLGFAFERFCRPRHLLIAKILGFHGIHYRAGAFYNEGVERKLELFPNPKRKTLQKVLITTEGATDSLITRHYFDSVITLDDLFAADSSL